MEGAAVCDCQLENPPTFYEVRVVKGRKQYRCSECLSTIEKGERHEYAKGLWEGQFSTFRTCQTCCNMRDEIKLTCYYHGQMMDELDERDYPLHQSVADFQKRRRENWAKHYAKKRQAANQASS